MKRALAPALLALTLCAGAADPPGREAWAGLPAGLPVQVLQNPGFLVGYSDARRQPLWVAYRAESLKGRRSRKRDSRFEPDPRVARPLSDKAYGGTGYDRGHNAPSYLIGRLYGRAAQSSTYLMSNISPQAPRLNELVWQRLEEAEADIVAPGAVELWVLTGPVFGAQPPITKKRGGIPVPEAFYRIWIDLRDGEPAALAFVVPQDVCGTEPLSGYLTSVDEIERRTGLDFFAELPDPQETKLERAQDVAGWRLERYDRQAPRYGDKFDLSQCAH